MFNDVQCVLDFPIFKTRHRAFVVTLMQKENSLKTTSRVFDLLSYRSRICSFRQQKLLQFHLDVAAELRTHQTPVVSLRT
jgi:hypothetical protein